MSRTRRRCSSTRSNGVLSSRLMMWQRKNSRRTSSKTLVIFMERTRGDVQSRLWKFIHHVFCALISICSVIIFMAATKTWKRSSVIQLASLGSHRSSYFTKSLPRIEKTSRWRVALMEKGIAELDFENVDQMIQVHGTSPLLIFKKKSWGVLMRICIDYEGVGLTSRDANSKKAASEATAIFQNYYPEFLVCSSFSFLSTLLSYVDTKSLILFTSTRNSSSTSPPSSPGSSGSSSHSFPLRHSQRWASSVPALRRLEKIFCLTSTLRSCPRGTVGKRKLSNLFSFLSSSSFWIMWLFFTSFESSDLPRVNWCLRLMNVWRKLYDT